MSENLPSVRQPRAQRHTTSCGECRKRKQRCNQGHPCSNCARRFPQPVCEYKENKRKEGFPIPNTSTFLLETLQSRAENDRLLSGTQDPLLPIARSPITKSDPESEQIGLATWSDVDILTAFPNSQTCDIARQAWGDVRPGILPQCLPHCNDHSNAYHDAARLLEYTNQTANQFVQSLGSNSSDDEVDWEQLVANSAAPESGFPGFFEADTIQNLPVASTKLKADLLQVCEFIQGPFFLRRCSFSPRSRVHLSPEALEEPGRDRQSTPVQLLRQTIAADVNLLSRFKCAIDGNPDFNGPYHKIYMPFCFQSPLLVNIAIHTAASYMHETKHLDKMLAIAIKGQAIRMLNHLLRSERGTGDEAIAGVSQLIADEWYWGAAQDLNAHLRGMRELIKVRGGFNSLGLGGLLAKIVIVLDYSIAIALEATPYLQTSRENAYSDPAPGPFRIYHNTPLVASMVRFADCAQSLKLSTATASILDDVRFLLAMVTSLPSTPTDLNKVAATSHWILNRIAQLPVSAAESNSSQVSTPGSLSSQQNFKSKPPMGDSPSDSSKEQTSDPVYQAIRLAALLYVTAILERRPFSKACSHEQFYELWTMVWRVPLARWRGLAGIFVWIIAIILPTASTTPHSRFVKSMITTPGLSIGIENWFAASSALRNVLSLQAWLNGEDIVDGSDGEQVFKREDSSSLPGGSRQGSHHG